MKFTVVTLFPQMIESAFQEGVVGTARSHGLFGLECVNPRSFVHDVHRTVDDRPYGGGDGMVMLAEPLRNAIETAQKASQQSRVRTLYLSPHGRPFTQKVAEELLGYEQVILVSGRYGGIDHRVLASQIDEEISLGDFVLSGGEVAAIAVIDTVARLIPGVLGNRASAFEESFSGQRGWLEAPQFTRPPVFEDKPVPEVLMGGNHGAIAKWRRDVSLLLTATRRPDLLEKSPPQPTEISSALILWQSMSVDERAMLGLASLRENLFPGFVWAILEQANQMGANRIRETQWSQEGSP